MKNGLSRFSLLTALMVTVLVFTAEAASFGTIKLICRYPVEYPSSNESLTLIPTAVEIDRGKSTVSWNGAVSGVAANITDKRITFSFSEFMYEISRTSGEIQFFSPQGLERANEYRREMLQGFLRQGKSIVQAQAEVEAGLENKIFAHEYRGICDLSY